jgi:hypothetical protein
VIEGFLLGKRPGPKKAAMLETGSGDKEDSKEITRDSVPATEAPIERPYDEGIDGPARKRHERLVERRREIRRPHPAGAKLKDIAGWTGTSRSTVYRYRELVEPPPRPEYERKASVLDAWGCPTRLRAGTRVLTAPSGPTRRSASREGYSHGASTP